ncbi:DNA mismatch endonuclease Vsr [Noviherbaspirillum cavernae]|uniref:Very short patch repair endonuclease n=1 Tax=Noviherbaspirillum cavernae TaxID=2320862 RepID=A0A418WVC3_9BURK|nr:very short patch repair endonuclease [Noviherbaspirillum cavernae]RJF96646.1 DNA mismatch endonuclease Vsr [Noviherbaspirillum cavernae]
MVDVVDKSTRSRMMAGIRGKDTSPEFAVRRFLHARGLRYRLHVKQLPGKPDLVFARYNVALFVHGCFWHRHAGCRYATTPASNTDFWQKKFDDNQRRDRKVVKELQKAGWRVLVIWECEINESRLASLYRRITKAE